MSSNNITQLNQQNANQQGVQASQLANTSTTLTNALNQGISGSILSSGYAGTSAGSGGYLTSGGYLGQPTWTTSVYMPQVDPNTFSVRKVENGYILSRAGKEYVVTDEKSVEKFLKLAGIVL